MGLYSSTQSMWVHNPNFSTKNTYLSGRIGHGIKVNRCTTETNCRCHVSRLSLFLPLIGMIESHYSFYARRKARTGINDIISLDNPICSESRGKVLPHVSTVEAPLSYHAQHHRYLLHYEVLHQVQFCNSLTQLNSCIRCTDQSFCQDVGYIEILRNIAFLILQANQLCRYPTYQNQRRYHEVVKWLLVYIVSRQGYTGTY